MSTLKDCNDDHRRVGAATANAEDAALWRWFSMLMQEARIRWCRGHAGYFVSVDHQHVATEADFDAAIRAAKKKCSNITATRKRQLL
ncbi:hypothetical protein [Paraburkholderia phymatum]|uniref:hypothetical protein n=1 Tax=Paraburkholderia phymatum TaxID=148447 RepID=UPI00319D90F7